MTRCGLTRNTNDILGPVQSLKASFCFILLSLQMHLNCQAAAARKKIAETSKNDMLTQYISGDWSL